MHLPFKDDMREGVPVTFGMAEADEVCCLSCHGRVQLTYPVCQEQVAKAKKLIKRINAKNWSLEQFSDPGQNLTSAIVACLADAACAHAVLQTHFDALEALALARPEIKATPNDMSKSRHRRSFAIAPCLAPGWPPEAALQQAGII